MAKRKSKTQVQTEKDATLDLELPVNPGNPDIVDVLGTRAPLTYENLPLEESEAEFVYSVPETLNVLEGTSGFNSVSVRFNVTRGTKLRVIGHKEETDGVQWIRVSLPDNPRLAGWVASSGNTEPE